VQDLPPDVSFTDYASCPQQVPLVMLRPVTSAAQSTMEWKDRSVMYRMQCSVLISPSLVFIAQVFSEVFLVFGADLKAYQSVRLYDMPLRPTGHTLRRSYIVEDTSVVDFIIRLTVRRGYSMPPVQAIALASLVVLREALARRRRTNIADTC